MASALKELGRRLSVTRSEARVSLEMLASSADVRADLVQQFENGNGGLGASQLIRIARVLGVPPAPLLHPDAKPVTAPIEPAVFLKTASGAAMLAESDRSALAKALIRARDFASLSAIVGCENLVNHFVHGPPPAENAHEDGYKRAMDVRALMPERGQALRGLRRLIEDRFGILVVLHSFSEASVQGAACRASGHRLIAVNSRLSETARRFVLAHELAHHGFDLGDNSVTADEFDGMSRFWFETTPVEKRANAFAAMLIAPWDAVQTHFGPAKKIDSLSHARELVDGVTRTFGLGFSAATWHLHNLKYFDRSVVTVLSDTAPTADIVSGLEEETPYDGLERRTFQALSANSISLARGRELIGDRVEAFVRIGA